MVGKKKIDYICLALVLATGLVLGFFIWESFFTSYQHAYRFNFTRAQWLVSAPDGGSQGYFRKKIYISQPVEHAWLEVTGTDSYILYINGHVAGSQRSDYNMDVSGIYDIRSQLHSGTNVIGLEVRRVAHPGRVRVIAQGSYSYSAAGRHDIATDTTWKSSSVEQSQENGSTPWYSDDFNDNGWQHATVAKIDWDRAVQPLSVAPAVCTFRQAGSWIGDPDATRRSISLEREFTLPGGSRGVWLRIGARDSYILSVNGSVLKVSSAAASSPSKNLNSFQVVNIAPYVRSGRNRIDVNVTALTSPCPELVLDGIAALPGGGARTVLRSDAKWKIAPASGRKALHAIVLGAYSPFEDNFTFRPAAATPPNSYYVMRAWGMIVCLGLVLLLTLVLWRASTSLCLRIDGAADRGLMRRIDALFHAPPLIVLSFFYLLQFDIRFSQDDSFQHWAIYIPCALLLVFRLILWSELLVRRDSSKAPSVEAAPAPDDLRRRRAFYFASALLVIVLSAFILRFQNLAHTSYSHDETSIRDVVAQAVKDRSYPTIKVGPIEKPLTTYEALPYPIISSILMFGKSDLAGRLPSVLFSIATLLLIFYIVSGFWGMPAGLLAAAAYGLFPFCIFWGSNLFHPQQSQFFALSTCYLFYRTFELPGVHTKYVYATAGSLLLTYLSWEGTGLLLVALALYLLISRHNDLSFLWSKHFWIASILLCVGIIIELSCRSVYSPVYLMLGSGLAGKTISLPFLTPLYDPTYYIRNFLLAVNNAIFSVVIIAGIAIVINDRFMRYCISILLLVLFLMTNFMSNQSVRYGYYILPLLLIPASGVVAHFCRYIKELISKWRLTTGKAVGYLSIILFCFVFLMSSSNTLLELNKIGYANTWMGNDVSPIIAYRPTYQFLKSHIKRGDIIMALMPQALKYYTGITSNYYIQSYTSEQILYVHRHSSQGYMDKYVGSTVIRNLTELQNAFARYRRIWIIMSPASLFADTNNQDIVNYVNENTKVVFEGFATKVCLWNRND